MWEAKKANDMNLDITCISDTHHLSHKLALEHGDVLVHSGDWSNRGTESELTIFCEEVKEWKKKFNHIIIIAGNHDWIAQRNPDFTKASLEAAGALYLCDSGCEVNGFRFWGSPWQPEFGNWAFNKKRGRELFKVWARIPKDTDVLVTHGPPYGTGDLVEHPYSPNTGSNVGCVDLKSAIRGRKNIKLHIFGHIHSGSGIYMKSRRFFINAAVLDDSYSMKNSPRKIVLTKSDSEYIVYGLVDPRDHKIKYVGKSCKGIPRIYEHYYGKELTQKSKKSSWIKSLISQNLAPYFVIIAECLSAEECAEKEEKVIQDFLLKGLSLTNMTSGGTGGDTGGGQKRRRPVVSKNIKTGEIKHYDFVTQTAEGGFEPTKVVSVCRGKRKSHKGYEFYYKDAGVEVIPKMSNLIQITNTSTSEVFIANNTKDAALITGLSSRSISDCLRHGRNSRNYKLEYLLSVKIDD